MNKVMTVFALLAFLTAGAIADETYTASSVAASQTLPNQGKNNYDAKNLLDENEKTIWAATFEGSPITLKFKTNGATIGAIYVTNGYHKDQKSLVNNSQAKDVNIYINGKKVKSVTLTKVTELSSGGEIIDLGKEYSGVKEFALEITSIYAGKKWNDLCIADVGYYGNQERSGSVEEVPSASYAGTMKDRRDGKTYKTVKIGDKVWMAENLNYRTGESKCYENKPKNCDKYGRLYVWREAVTACPNGWHLPSKEEFEELEKLAGQKAGDIKKAGTVLKSTTGWEDDDYVGKSGNGTDGLGFGALPAGFYSSYVDDFGSEGSLAHFWSSTANGSDDAYGLGLYSFYKDAHVSNDYKDDGFSVRCVKN